MYWETDGTKMYEGSWVKGCRHGHGTSYYEGCKEYEGEWVGDYREGLGSEWNDDGTLEFHGMW